MKKVFLENLPKRGKTQVDWYKSIGFTVDFAYDDIKGEINILSHERFDKMSYIKVQYKDKIMDINTSSFIQGAIGMLIGSKTYEYLYKIGDIIQDDNRKMLIMDQIKIKKPKSNERGYRYKCLIDEYIGTMTEDSLKSGTKCSVCSNKKIIKGVNDTATTEPNTVKYFSNIEDAYKYSKFSTKEIDIKCPDCGFGKRTKICTLNINGFSCPCCGDGISYPNKFMYNLLEQLKNLNLINKFETEKIFDWLKYKFKEKLRKGRLDFYFESDNKEYGIEMDGGWHTKDNTMSGQTAEESKIIDDEKDKLVKEHDIEIIRINCDESKLEPIKNSIMSSELPKLLNFKEQDIDWLKCHEFSCSSLVKVACNHWKDGINNTLEISKLMIIGRQTILKYLKQGFLLGWCDYDVEEVMKRSGKLLSQNNNIPIVQLSLSGEYISEFNSAMEAEKILGIKSLNNHIGSCCKGNRNQAGQFRWMYKDDYDLQKDNIKTEIKINNQRRVIQLSLDNKFIKEWETIKEIKETLKIYDISNCCKNKPKHKTAGGFKWMYKEDYEVTLLTT